MHPRGSVDSSVEISLAVITCSVCDCVWSRVSTWSQQVGTQTQCWLCCCNGCVGVSRRLQPSTVRMSQWLHFSFWHLNNPWKHSSSARLACMGTPTGMGRGGALPTCKCCKVFLCTISDSKTLKHCSKSQQPKYLTIYALISKNFVGFCGLCPRPHWGSTPGHCWGLTSPRPLIFPPLGTCGHPCLHDIARACVCLNLAMYKHYCYASPSIIASERHCVGGYAIWPSVCPLPFRLPAGRCPAVEICQAWIIWNNLNSNRLTFSNSFFTLW